MTSLPASGAVESASGTTVTAPAKRRGQPARTITRGLIIRPEPLEKILRGQKTWEMRSRPVAIRETIALVRKGSKAIYGVADLVACHGPLTPDERRAARHLHGIDPDRWRSDPSIAKYDYAWELANVRRLEAPIPYIHRGGVQFVTLDDGAISQLTVALASD